MLIAARAVQGCGAALMMPMALAITSAVYPKERRGWALGVLAGASAFFAALGPVLGGLLTSIDWRLVFWINVPLAITTVVLTLRATPDFQPVAGRRPRIDYLGTATFGLGIAALVLGLSQGQDDGWAAPDTLVPLGAAVVLLVAFVIVELRVKEPLLEFRLFRHLNFLAANISQFLAGMIELGLGFLMPFYLLLVVGVSPAVAGIALIPATIPIILAGPLAGRAYDRVGGRIPLVAGFLVLAASGATLAVLASEQSVAALIPGLFLQASGSAWYSPSTTRPASAPCPRRIEARPRARSTPPSSSAGPWASPRSARSKSAWPNASPTTAWPTGASRRAGADRPIQGVPAPGRGGGQSQCAGRLGGRPCRAHGQPARARRFVRGHVPDLGSDSAARGAHLLRPRAP